MSNPNPILPFVPRRAVKPASSSVLISMYGRSYQREIRPAMVDVWTESEKRSSDRSRAKVRSNPNPLHLCLGCGERVCVAPAPIPGTAQPAQHQGTTVCPASPSRHVVGRSGGSRQHPGCPGFQKVRSPSQPSPSHPIPTESAQTTAPSHRRFTAPSLSAARHFLSSLIPGDVSLARVGARTHQNKREKEGRKKSCGR